MKTKNYLRLTSFLFLFFGFIALLLFICIPFIFFVFLTKNTEFFQFTLKDPNALVLFSYHKSISGNPHTDATRHAIVTFVGILSLLLTGTTFWKISQLFRNLSMGETPFALKKIRDLQIIGRLFCLASFVPLLVYSPLLTLFTGEIDFVLGIDYSFIVGLILLVMAEVFRYGLKLQEFQEDVV